MPSSRGSSQLRDQARVSYIAGRFFTTMPSGKHLLFAYFSLISLLAPILTFYSNSCLSFPNSVFLIYILLLSSIFVISHHKSFIE